MVFLSKEKFHLKLFRPYRSAITPQRYKIAIYPFHV